MADKKSNEPRRENGRIPTYQTAYHGAKKKDPLTNLARIIVEKFDKRRVPENTIDTIPFDQIYPDGLCRIGDNFYSKMVQFYDINYQLAQNDEKQHIFAEYCQFLNYFDETIHFQFCFINQRVDMEEYKKVISIPDQNDEFNVVRREYATYLRNQLEKGNNGIVKSKYLVFGIEARDRKQAVSRLAKIESDVINKFKLLGCKCVPVNGLERLRIMHDYLNQDSLEKFAMKSFKDVVESGLTPKNFITPTSFDFRAKDYYKIGDMFATTNFLVISAPEISDEMLADILNMEDALSVTMHIDTLNQTEAMKYINLNYSDDDDPVSLKADFILSFMELVVGGKSGLKPEEKSAIDFAVSRIYTKYFENPVPENMPILQDLYNELLQRLVGITIQQWLMLRLKKSMEIVSSKLILLRQRLDQQVAG